MEKIDYIRKEAKDVYEMVLGTELEPKAKQLHDGIKKNLDKVVVSQRELPTNPQEHISQYRENVKIMETVEIDLTVMREMMGQARVIPVKMTWKLIIGMLIFLALLSAGFYLMWQRQIKFSDVPTFDEEISEEEKKEE